MSNRLQNKIALVTGGNSGIGLATAKRFVEEGAFVYITGRRQPELDAAVKEIGKSVTAIQGDVANLNDLDRLFAQIKKEKGTLDILFANAAAGEFLSLDKLTEEHFDKWFNVNVKGTVFTVHKALPLLKDGSSVIFNGSIAGVKGMPAFGVYSATKAAVRSFARSFTTDLKDRKIRFNVISPGPIATPGLSKVAGSEEAERQFKEQLASQVPLGRVGEAVEVANVAVFLASGESSFIAGAEIFVDGGMVQV